MKKISYFFPIIIFMMSTFIAYTPDKNQEFQDDTPTPGYEVKSDIQLPMSSFIGSLPNEYAALK